jgi:S1-C subfamily serine protease
LKVAWISLLGFALGCGGTQTRAEVGEGEGAAPAAAPAHSDDGAAPAVSGAPAASSSAAVAAPPAGSPRIARRDLLAVLSPGMGAFLRTVEVEPAMAGGKFHGWRIVRVARGAKVGELAPGDVITSVNGRSVERPEQALEVWQSLALANELRVAYERGGTRREAAYAIVDGPK